MRLRLSYDEKDPATQQALGFAERRLYVARGLIPSGYESYFQETAQYLSAHTSTAIEGNLLGDEEAMLVLVEGADSDEPMEVEKVNLEQTYELMASLAADKTTRIDEGIIRTVNSLVLKGLPGAQARNRGKYRVGPSLVIDAASREIRYRPPRAEVVLELMQDLVASIEAWRRDHPGPVAAALAHFGLLSIHPFEDGNGRTARLIADMLLDLTGWSADGMVSVSQVIHQRLPDYYQSLRETQGEDFREEVDVTRFVRFHTDALGAAAARLEENTVRFSQLRDRFAEQMSGALNARQVTGLMFMIDIGRISSSRYAELTRSSPATALADLNALLKAGLIERQGAGRNTRYRLGDRLAGAIAAPPGKPQG